MTDSGILTAEEMASIRRDFRGASLLPGRAYQEAGIFAWERAEILRRDWVMVAREEDVPEPGSYQLVTLDGEDLIIVHGDPDAQIALEPKVRALGLATHVPHWHERVTLD